MSIKDIEKPQYYKYLDSCDEIYIRVYYKGVVMVFNGKYTTQVTRHEDINLYLEGKLSDAIAIKPSEFELEFNAALKKIQETARF